MKTRPCLTERLLMGLKELKQANKQTKTPLVIYNGQPKFITSPEPLAHGELL